MYNITNLFRPIILLMVLEFFFAICLGQFYSRQIKHLADNIDLIVEGVIEHIEQQTIIAWKIEMFIMLGF